MLGSGHFSYVGSYNAVPAGADGVVTLTPNGQIALAGLPKGPWTGVPTVHTGAMAFYAYDKRQAEGSQVPFTARYKLTATLAGQTTVTKTIHSGRGQHPDQSMAAALIVVGSPGAAAVDDCLFSVRRDSTIGSLMELVLDETYQFVNQYQIKLKPGVILSVELSYSGSVDSNVVALIGAGVANVVYSMGC